MPWDSQGEAPKTSARDRYKRMMPAGATTWVLVAVLTALGAFYAFTFHVNPDELGVVMRFGKVVRQEPPGLHFRLPYPIDEVRLPKVTQQNIIEVGLRTSLAPRGDAGSITSMREESRMLTGDENIVDVSFVVYWRIQDPLKYLFNIQNPEISVRDAAESAMREVVGQSEVQSLLTAGRQKVEQEAQKLAQSVLDHYGAGIRIDQVRLQRIDPPTQVIDAFRDVQAAVADKEKLQSEASRLRQPYCSRGPR